MALIWPREGRWRKQRKLGLGLKKLAQRTGGAEISSKNDEILAFQPLVKAK